MIVTGKLNTYQGNVGKVIADVAALTIKQLDEFGIPYDEIYFGKPAADVYVDDKAINANDNLGVLTDGLLNK